MDQLSDICTDWIPDNKYMACPTYCDETYVGVFFHDYEALYSSAIAVWTWKGM